MDESEVIIGGASVEVLNQLSIELRNKTVDFARQESSNKFLSEYTPWMCLYPIKTKPPKRLLSQPENLVGSVVMQEDYLTDIANFIDNNPHLIQTHLIGTAEDWKVLTDIELQRPQMAYEIEDICTYIRDVSPFFNSVFNALVTNIIPLKQSRARGLSSDLIRGTLFLGYPPGYSSILLAMDVVHEMGHQALSILLSADPIFISDPDQPVYSEIRHTERPAIQSLHAASAIAYMVHLIKDTGCPQQLHPDCPDDLSKTLLKAISSLNKACQFTEVGEQILSDFNAVALR